MMRRIDLDYAVRRSRTGWVLLGIGICTVGATVILYAGLAGRSTQWEQAALKTARQDAAAVAVHDDPEGRRRFVAKVGDANEVIGRLSLPWNDLFRSIEASAIDKVALLSVQPQPQQHLVILNGEVRLYGRVLRIDPTSARAADWRRSIAIAPTPTASRRHANSWTTGTSKRHRCASSRSCGKTRATSRHWR